MCVRKVHIVCLFQFKKLLTSCLCFFRRKKVNSREGCGKITRHRSSIQALSLQHFKGEDGAMEPFSTQQLFWLYSCSKVFGFHLHTPDFPCLYSFSAVKRVLLIVDFAGCPRFYYPGISIAFTVTWDCLIHLSRENMQNYTLATYQVTVGTEMLWPKEF